MKTSAPDINRLLARLDGVHDDVKLRAALANYAAVDLDGRPIPSFIYRLVCGHLVQLLSIPVEAWGPDAPLELYCPRSSCRATRDIVERLL